MIIKKFEEGLRRYFYDVYNDGTEILTSEDYIEDEIDEPFFDLDSFKDGDFERDIYNGCL